MSEEKKGSARASPSPLDASHRSSHETPSLLDRAIYIAAGAHNGQIDKGGAPYIHHVLRVMRAMTSDDARATAVLHDVLEDCSDWTPERLRDEGIPQNVVEAVLALTRGEDEGYEAFIRRVALNPLAAEVKRADLIDNMDLTRLRIIGRGDMIRVEKYERALKALGAATASPAIGSSHRLDAISQSSTEGLVDLIRGRIGQDFDGECHLTEEEALALASTIEALTAERDEIAATLEDREERLTATAKRWLAAEAARDQALAQVGRLREALEEAALQLEYTHGRFSVTGSGTTVLAKITAALADLTLTPGIRNEVK